MNDVQNLNVAITSTTAHGDVEIGKISFLGQSIDLCEGRTQVIGTGPELLDIVSPAPEYIYIKNMGGVDGGRNSELIVDSVSSFDAFPQRIVFGASLCLCPQTSIIYVMGTTAPCRIWVMSAN
jgi:hypothetical protein